MSLSSHIQSALRQHNLTKTLKNFFSISQKSIFANSFGNFFLKKNKYFLHNFSACAQYIVVGHIPTPIMVLWKTLLPSRQKKAPATLLAVSAITTLLGNLVAFFFLNNAAFAIYVTFFVNKTKNSVITEFL